MPVPATRLSLATAKTWAKRLAKVSRDTDTAHPWPLARCQLAVATMLGYDHWHALNQALGEVPPASQASVTALNQTPSFTYLKELAAPAEPAG